MSCPFCSHDQVDSPVESMATEVATPKCGVRNVFSRIGSALKWLTPTVVLILIPKCPLCVAAYIALGTGVSVALPVATWIRYGLLVACFAMLGYLAISMIRGCVPSFSRPRYGRGSVREGVSVLGLNALK